MVILIKSDTTVEFQLTYVHAYVGNTSLGVLFTVFYLVGLLETPTVVSIDSNIAFANAGDKIQLPVTELILRAATGDLARSKKQRYWVAINTILLLPFLVESSILDREMAEVNLLNIFTKCISEKGA